MASDAPVIHIPTVGGQTIIHSAHLCLVVTCKCGSPTPIAVHFMPGIPMSAFCPACQMKFQVGRFIFDIERNAGQVNAGICEIQPTIVKPSVM